LKNQSAKLILYRFSQSTFTAVQIIDFVPTVMRLL